MTAKQFKKKKLNEELEKQANGGDVEVDDKHYLSIIELREKEIERQQDWREWEPTMKVPEKLREKLDHISHLDKNHICHKIAGEDPWFSEQFGCDYGRVMEMYF